MRHESISIVRFHDVLMVTLPASSDDATICALQEEVLQAMERYRTRGLLLDLSAVESLDSFFARTIVETARMVALMGGRTVLTGMRPSVAITSTQLGLSLGHAQTALNADRALQILISPIQTKKQL
jgi:rsbT antagonist protein RsbS